MSWALDFIVCTYEREDLLEECIESILSQINGKKEFNVIIVNNSKKPFTKSRVLEFENHLQVTIIQEETPGLSRARNAAIRKSRADWLAFVDDDARLDANYVNILEKLISLNKYDCLGGAITSWWKYGKPKWLLHSYGEKPLLRPDFGPIQKDEYNWGSNIIIRRQALEESGLFPTYTGMKGKKVGYAAENIVQYKLRKRGYKIGYDPELSIQHVVAKHKLDWKWHIRSMYATGRDGISVFEDQYNWNGFFKNVKTICKAPFVAISNLIVRTDYYWQNAVLEVVNPVALFVGKIRAKLL